MFGNGHGVFVDVEASGQAVETGQVDEQARLVPRRALLDDDLAAHAPLRERRSSPPWRHL